MVGEDVGDRLCAVFDTCQKMAQVIDGRLISTGVGGVRGHSERIDRFAAIEFHGCLTELRPVDVAQLLDRLAAEPCPVYIDPAPIALDEDTVSRSVGDNQRAGRPSTRTARARADSNPG